MKNKRHILLKQYRIIYIVIVLFFIWLGWDAWQWFKFNHSALQEWNVAAFVSIYGAVIAALKFAMEKIQNDREHD